MNYKFVCIILLQSLFLLGGDDDSAQPARSVVVSSNSVMRLRSMVHEYQDEGLGSVEQNFDKQEAFSAKSCPDDTTSKNSVDLVKLVKDLASRVEELERKEKSYNNLELKIDELDKKIQCFSRVFEKKKKEETCSRNVIYDHIDQLNLQIKIVNESLFEIEFKVEEFIESIDLSLSEHLKSIEQRINIQRNLLLKKIDEIEKEIKEKSIFSAPPNTPSTARGSSVDQKK